MWCGRPVRKDFFARRARRARRPAPHPYSMFFFGFLFEGGVWGALRPKSFLISPKDKEGGIMRKLFFIGLPVLALLVVVAVARTEPNEDRDFNRKLREAWVISDGGYRLGVILSKVKPSQQEKWKIDSGVVVDEVLPDSAAEEAGIQKGDIILRVDGNEVSDASDLRKILKNMEEPKKLTIELLRDGKTLTLIATPEKDDFTFIRGVSRNYLGVELQELDADLAPYF